MAIRIYCPQCTWAPSPGDRWICFPGCRTVWNTFETRAKCPGCHKQWQVTICLACHVFSAHEDWYHDEGMDRDTNVSSRDLEEELVSV
jgi:hypothetical protein